jgi:subtilisin-like proprotein convertase family protein
MMKISANPDLEEHEPEVAYISSMHGDEVVGKELCFNLINYLTDNYGSDVRVTNLLDTTEIWIMPSMNPDGTELGQRWNAHGVDLNRDFPDQFDDPVNGTAGREPETAAVMNWRAARAINLSANLHGGELVANYPFDGNPAGSSTFSPTPSPDQAGFYSISRTYADNNPPMSQNNSHPAFDDGVTNGADWYAISGGMQDWEYVWYGDFEITLEVGTSKWPPASQLPDFWDDNLESMLSYFERVHEGVRGTVTDAETGAPLAARVQVGSNPFPAYTDPDLGDYHRLLVPGSYTLTVSADGYQSQVLSNVTVFPGAATERDAALVPLPSDLQPVASRLEDGGNGFFDPGEIAELAVTVHNYGQAVTTVAADLVPTGWYGGVTRPVASYPDLPGGGDGESLAPYHEVDLDAAVPVGHKVGYALSWSSDQGRGLSQPFFVVAGAPQLFTPAATDTPKQIPSFQQNVTITSQISYPDARQIEDLKVTVNIAHTYPGDLEIELTSPQGTSATLHNHTGGSVDNIVGTYGENLTPADPLSVFAGENAAGTWTLAITDVAIGDGGWLQAWNLKISSFPDETTTPEMRFRDLVPEADGVRLEWWPYPGLDSYRVYRATDPSSSSAFLDVTSQDANAGDTRFKDTDPAALAFYLVTGVGPNGEGPKGHFGE